LFALEDAANGDGAGCGGAVNVTSVRAPGGEVTFAAIFAVNVTRLRVCLRRSDVCGPEDPQRHFRSTGAAAQ
jgi:hypothetical protein